eukprot:368448-Rhodomonas_salina.3
MFGTDIAHVGIRLRVCYAVSGTNIADGGICLRTSSTDVAYQEASRRGRSTQKARVASYRPRHSLCNVRYRHSIWRQGSETSRQSRYRNYWIRFWLSRTSVVHARTDHACGTTSMLFPTSISSLSMLRGMS